MKRQPTEWEKKYLWINQLTRNLSPKYKKPPTTQQQQQKQLENGQKV